LFLTFSRNARVRIEREVEKFQEQGWAESKELRSLKISNYHAFYLEVLRRKAGFWGCNDRLRPASIWQREQRLGSILEEAGVESLDLSNSISQAKLVFALRRFDLADLMGTDSALLLDDQVLEVVYRAATGALREGRPYYDDFAPLLLHLLEHCPALVEWLRVTYPILILDEFQDTDSIQWEVIRRIHPERIVILFDRYQMIYEWRGARANRIDQARTAFDIPSEAEGRLTQIHRVGAEADVAQYIQELRLDELRGTAITTEIRQDWLVTRKIERWSSCSPGQWSRIPDATKCLQELRYGRFIDFDESTAVLTRANYLADFLYENLRVKKKGQHYRCRWIGGENNPDEIIRDHVWRLRYAKNDIDLRRWFGELLDRLLPRQFLSDLQLEFADEFACDGSDLLKRRRKTNLCAVREELRSWWSTVRLGDYVVFARVLQKIPYLANSLLQGDGFLDPDILYYVRELRRAAEGFCGDTEDDDWQEFCDHLEDRLVRSTYLRLRTQPRGLYILTVHQSKGREFDHIIIPWLSGKGEPCESRTGSVFPLPYDYEDFEDRRLLYVALTRARSHVTILYPEEDPSPFICRWRLDP
jgi:superfamily I DNA/RNA helicase